MTVLQAERQGAPGLPPLWAGHRRRHLSLLVVSGLGQAAAAGIGALLLSEALRGQGPVSRPVLFVLLVAAALGVGLLRMVEKVLAERLSQEYVHEIRLGLIRGNLADGQVRSLGVAVARTTNDLTSVKNWASQGVAPLAVGIPLILGASVALFWLEPWFVVALAVPIGILLVAMALLAPAAYQRSRLLRRRRGRLSSQVADTVLSTAAIRSAGGSDRELRRIAELSGTLVAAAIDRARIAGALRGSAAAASGIASAMIVGAGLWTGMPTHSIAAGLVVVGFLSSPVNDLGRVAEYRQTYRAARRIIGPAMPRHDSAATMPTRRPVLSPGVRGTASLRATGVRLSDGRTMAALAAEPGDRIVVDAGDKRLTSEALEQLVGLHHEPTGRVLVGSLDVRQADPKQLRSLVGYAAQGMMLVRGSVVRSVRYRCPDAPLAEVDRLLAAVQLADRVAALPAGIDTTLVHGGDPLTIPERARLLLARATLGEPAVLVLDHVDADLGSQGRSMLRTLLRDYPGVVLMASDEPGRVLERSRIWGAATAASTRAMPPASAPGLGREAEVAVCGPL